MMQTIAAPELVSFDDLRTLTGCSKVCITVAIAIPDPAQAEPTLKNAVREAGRRLDEFLKHFFKEIDQRIHAILGRADAPLILAGVESETALYRRVNSYPHLAEQTVSGSPDGLTPRELYNRALDIVNRMF